MQYLYGLTMFFRYLYPMNIKIPLCNYGQNMFFFFFHFYYVFELNF